MPGRLHFSLPLAALAIPLFAHDPITTNLTWTKEISRIVYKHCATCHAEKGASMPLITWQQARPWAKAIRDEVATRRMPPWGPVAGAGEFANDRSLSTPEIELLIAWVEGGAPEGDPAYLPARIPAAPVAERPRYNRSLNIVGTTTLNTPGTLIGIKPASALEAWAEEPDGTVTRLIWINQLSRYFTGPYFYQTPQRFPAGTKLHATAKATLYLRR